MAIFKDALKEIIKRFSQFVSIVLIVMLGVGFFVGIRVSGEDMRITGDEYFRATKLMDLRLVSTLGFDEPSMQLLRQFPEFKQVQPGYSVDSFGLLNGNERNLKLFSYQTDQQLNQLILLEGNLPLNSNEMLLDSVAAKINKVEIGDLISLSSDKLLKNEFIVVGIIESPLYIALERGTSSIGDGQSQGFAYLPAENFDLEVYNEVYVQLDYRLSVFDEEYIDYINVIKQRLDVVLPEMNQQRYLAVVYPLKDELNDGWQKYNDGKATFEREIKSGQNQLNSAKATLDFNSQQLYDNINFMFHSLGISTIDKQPTNVKLYQSAQRTADNYFLQQKQAIQYAYYQLDRLPRSNDEEEAFYQSKLLELQTQEAQLLQAETLGNSELAKIKVGAEQLDQGYSQFYRQQSTFLKAKVSGEKTLADNLVKLTDAQQAINEIEVPTVYKFTRNDNPGYSGLKEDSQRIQAIGELFPLIFFLVAAMVCLSTFSRMVDEHRVEIGTLRGLGYSTFAISAKYLLFATASTSLGILLGGLLGFTFIPLNVYHAYSTMYNLPALIKPVLFEYLWLPISLTILVGPGIAWLSVRQLVKQVPANLMRPVALPPGQHLLIERITWVWNKLSFLQKVTMRNIFRNKVRIAMIVLGIAGCSGLLVTGFGLNHSVMSINTKQFTDIFKYDTLVTFKYETAEYQKMMELINTDENITDSVSIISKNLDIQLPTNKYGVHLQVWPDTNSVSTFVNLQQRNGKTIKLSDDGVIISEKLAILGNLKVGDLINLIDEENEVNWQVKINGITENYVFHYVYMTNNYYQQLTSDSQDPNVVMLKLQNIGDNATADISKKLMESPKVLAVTQVNKMRQTFASMMGNFRNVIYIVVVASALLAFIVLYNLGNMNINERQRELATIKVLGFNRKETNQYIDRETYLLSVIGILFGMVFGWILHRFVITTAEIDMVMFNRELLFSSYLYSILMTLGFIVFTNLFLHYKINKIEMTSALKSIE